MSLDSFVFLDDSAYETGLTAAMLPGITAITASYEDKAFINKIKDAFTDTPNGSDRTCLYREQKDREKERLIYTTTAEYNASLNTSIACSLDAPEQADRISELSQRTNQFNLSGKRYTTDEIKWYIDCDDYNVISLSVSDKYGDMGLVGTAIVKNGTPAVIEGFFISCRVFGRGFENLLLNKIKSSFKKVAGIYINNEKNRRFSDFYENNGVHRYEYKANY